MLPSRAGMPSLPSTYLAVCASCAYHSIIERLGRCTERNVVWKPASLKAVMMLLWL